jgi:superfamily I DNA/RNA helicase
MITRIKEDKPHIIILKAILSLRFNVGRNLLIDFLVGNERNISVIKNNMQKSTFFGRFALESEKLKFLLDKMIQDNLIEVIPSKVNPLWKVLALSIRGQNELVLQKWSFANKKDFSYQENIICEKEEQEIVKYTAFLEGFNEEQKTAIVCDSSHILCIAGAGSGKTTVLTKRAEFLNKFKQVPAQKILAITFTRKAKQEMIRRLEKLNIKAQIHTFNSFCQEIINKNYYQIYGAKVNVLDFKTKFRLFNLAVTKLGIDFEDLLKKYFSFHQQKNKTGEQLRSLLVSDCFTLIDYYKIKKQKIEEFYLKANSKEYSLAKQIYEIVFEIVSLMKQNNLITYTDQVLDVIDFFEKNPQKIPFFEHILIDEYQDVNSMQIKLLNLLNVKNLFAVGDPRQSIFGWRGSDISFIKNFEKDYPNSRIIHLKKNYRSKESIVNFMNNCIKEMNLPDLDSLEFGGNIVCFNFKNLQEEINFISGNLRNQENKKIFVLARTNKQIRELSLNLVQEKIPHILKTEQETQEVLGKSKILLSTIHAIKGLEAKKVFVIGCNNLNFPCKASEHLILEMIKEDYDKFDEEKRLFYVGISRAKEELILTYTGKKMTPFINKEMKKLFLNF